MASCPQNKKMPMFTESVAAGFPSPATDYCEARLDLNEFCVKNPTATYFVRVQGDSMIEAGIFPGDVLIVDRSLTVKNGDIVIAAFNGELTVKKLEIKPKLRLVPMNNKYPAVDIPEDTDIEIFGVATMAVHSLRNL